MAGTGGMLMGANHCGVDPDGPFGALDQIGVTAQLVEEYLPRTVG